MAAVTQDLLIEQGTTFSWGFQVTYDGAALGDGWSAASDIRAEPSASSPVLFSFTCTVAAGVVMIAAAPTDSTDWSWTRGVYDVKITNTDGTVLRIAEGVVTVSPQVTP